MIQYVALENYQQFKILFFNNDKYIKYDISLKVSMKSPLLRLALLGAMYKPIKISVNEFAEKLKTSPMTASRRFKELDDKGLISRNLLGRSQAVKITDKGASVLRDEYLEYKSIFESGGTIELIGSIISGLGEGKYYLSLRGYTKQIEDKLGFSPYAGTLNVKLDRESIAARTRLIEIEPVRISGFKRRNRTYGGINCYSTVIEGIHGAIIIPDRSHYHNDVVEIIAPVSIKQTLGKDNSDLIKVVKT